MWPGSQSLPPTCCMVGCWLPRVGFPDSRGSSDTTCHLLLSSLLARLPLSGASAGPISPAPAPVKFQVLAPIDLPIWCPQTAALIRTLSPETAPPQGFVVRPQAEAQLGYWLTEWAWTSPFSKGTSPLLSLRFLWQEECGVAASSEFRGPASGTQALEAAVPTPPHLCSSTSFS